MKQPSSFRQAISAHEPTWHPVSTPANLDCHRTEPTGTRHDVAAPRWGPCPRGRATGLLVASVRFARYRSSNTRTSLLLSLNRQDWEGTRLWRNHRAISPRQRGTGHNCQVPIEVGVAQEPEPRPETATGTRWSSRNWNFTHGMSGPTAVLCCCTGSKRGPHQFRWGPLTCGN